jgi:hypothetical protein
VAFKKCINEGFDEVLLNPEDNQNCHFIHEIYAEGVGEFQQDIRDDYSGLDGDDFEPDVHRSEDWFSECMSVVDYTPRHSEIPQLEETSLIALFVYIFKLFLFLFSQNTQNLFGYCQAMGTWLKENILGTTSYHRQLNFLKAEHYKRIRNKWNSVDELPAYVAQEEALKLMQEIGLNSNANTTKFLQPSEVPIKAMVKLNLDQTNRPHVSCKVEGVPCSFLCDTGASISIISVKSFKKIPHHDTLVRTYDFPKIFDHSGNSIKVKFGVMCRVTFGSKTLVLKLLVSPISQTNVFGMDILLSKSLIYTNRGTDLYLVVGEVKCENRPAMKLQKDMPLFLVSDVVIAPETTRTVSVTPCLFPGKFDIEDEYIKVKFIPPTEAAQIRTDYIKLDDQGIGKIKICNQGLIDLPLPANVVIGTGNYDRDYTGAALRWAHKVNKKQEENPDPKQENVVEVAKRGLNDIIDPIEKKDAQNTVAVLSSKADLESTQAVQGTCTTTTVIGESVALATDILTVPCFCTLSVEIIVIKCNRFGDTICPYLGTSSYTRSPLTSGVVNKFRSCKKDIMAVYASTWKEFYATLQKIKVDETAAFIISNEDKERLPPFLLVKLVGGCTTHPFLYNYKPTFISFCRTIKGMHRQIIHNLTSRIVIEILNTKVELYFSEETSQDTVETGKGNQLAIPNTSNQLHCVLHLPAIISLKEHWIHNIVASIVNAYAGCVRILEPYVSPDANDYQTTLFNSILDKVAKLHGVSLQGRVPSKEGKVFDAHEEALKGCPCDYCVTYRQKHTYTDVRGMLDNQKIESIALNG